MVFQWFLVLRPSLSMVFDGFGPLVKRCDGFDGSSWSKVTMKQIDRSLGGPEFPVNNHNSSVASESSGQECRAGITVRPTQNPLSFLRDRGSLSHKLFHQEETTKNCCSANAHLGIVCQGITFTFDGSIASLPLPPGDFEE